MRWNKEKEQELKEIYPDTLNQKIAKRFGVSKGAIDTKASKMNLKKSKKYNHDIRSSWSKEETKYLRENYPGAKWEEMKEKLNRTKEQIQYKASRLKITRRYPWWQYDKEHRCRICGKIKSKEEFALSRGNPDNNPNPPRRHYCKKCWKEERKKYSDKQHKERREFMWELKEDKKCSMCGKTYPPPALVWHHQEDGKYKTKNVSQIWDKEKLIKEIEKCEILCANCSNVYHSSWSLVDSSR